MNIRIIFRSLYKDSTGQIEEAYERWVAKSASFL